MAIVYSHPQTDADIYAGQMRTTKAQIAKIQAEIDALQAECDRDPYYTMPRLRLAPLKQLRGALEAQLRGQEASHRSVGGSVDEGPRALTGGSYWMPADS